MILNATELGSGPPVVLVHGLFGMARNLGTIQRALAQRWRVLAVDLRNHGSSPHAPGMDYDTMADDLKETLDARGYDGIALMGHSMGGKTCMRFALRHGATVKRLCVADIAPVAYRPRNGPVVAALRRIPVGSAVTRAEAEAILEPDVPEKPVRAFLLQNLEFGPQTRWRIGLDEIEDGLHDIESWPESEGMAYEGPTLFVAGDRSEFINPGDREAMRTLFPHHRMATIKGAGHWVHVDNPSAFLGILESFLDTHRS